MDRGPLWILPMVCGALCLAAETPNPKTITPLTPSAQTFPVPSAWRRFQPGDPGYAFRRDFYFAEQGNYIRLRQEAEAPFVQTGLWRHLIPGHWQLNHFDPATYAKAAPPYQRLVDAWRENTWPLHTIQYHVMYGNPLPAKEAIAAAGDLWIGDNMPEAPIYRLDFLFEFLHTGKWRKKGSSVRPAMHEPMTRFLKDDLLPRLRSALPFCQDPAHVWTHRELRMLKDIYCAEFFRKIVKPVAWGMYVSPHFLASLPQTTCVAEKGADAFSNARAKGVMRQAGGGKFYFTWRGHEPTERYGYFRRGWYATPARQEWGYPLPHLWYYLFRPFFIGANYSIVEGMPGSLVQDVEEDGRYELSTLGHIAASLFDYMERVPERGTAYSAVALLRNYDRPNTHALSRWHIVEHDSAAYMNHGLLHEVIFPQHRHTRHSGGYSVTAPYGEIFDILAPNMPGKPVSPALFEGYKVLFALGGQRIEKDYATVLMDYVGNGGTLIINVEDLGAWLPPAFFGIKSLGADLEGRSITSELDGEESAENVFHFPAMTLGEANALYTCEGRPVVTKHRVGKGYAILVGARHMVQSEEVEVEMGRHGARRLMKPLLNFVPGFIERMTTGVTPFDIQIAAEDRPD
ncbi:MAG: hypothetical protein KAI66_15670, partial [Lentisphaeria bacterium]|nr:hypothetical protein [Lentisphaeria bacterium]